MARGGRGSGKTRAGAEDCLERIRSGEIIRVHILAPTFAEVRDVCIEGESGILACAKPGEVENYNRSLLEIYFSNGVKVKGFSAEDPDRLNGPQCSHAWVDEFYACGQSAIDQLMFGLRTGKRITSCFTSTPKNTPSTKYVLSLPDVVATSMRTRDNEANLAPSFIAQITKKYGGSRLARVELEGELVDDVEGALWSSSHFEYDMRRPLAMISRRGHFMFKPPEELVKVVVALDPTVADPEKKKRPDKEMDECGVIVAGCDGEGHGYILGDFTGVYMPSQWAQLAIKLYDSTKAISIVAEANQGGELIKEVLRGYSSSVNVQLVHASVGKRARAEPAAVLYDQGRVHHCTLGKNQKGMMVNVDNLRELEDQMCMWDPLDPTLKSPGRVDAMVWALHGLGLLNATGTKIHNRLIDRQF